MSLIISINILSYWRVGTGKGISGGLDELCHRDDLGLPMLPGKNLRGLLRDVVDRAHGMGWTKKVTAQDLFGSRADVGKAVADPPVETIPGKLRVSNARLPNLDRQAIAGNPMLVKQLCMVRRSTAMDAERGIARPRSLRFEEVAIPVLLTARLDPITAMPDDWAQALTAAAPLIRAVGSGRTRGLGRCQTFCSPIDQEALSDA